MTGNDLIQLLTQTTLANWCGVNQDTLDLDPAYTNRVVAAINEALIKVSSQFLVQENSFFIELIEGKTLYELTNEHIAPPAESANYDKYIRELPSMPFTGSVIKVMSVWDALGNRLPLNNTTHPESVFTPTATTLQIPVFPPSTFISIIYQAGQSKLDSFTLYRELDIADQLIPLVTAYVAYLLYSRINTQESMSIGAQYYQHYTALAQDLVQMDLLNQSVSQDNTKFTTNGWI